MFIHVIYNKIMLHNLTLHTVCNETFKCCTIFLKFANQKFYVSCF